MTLKESRVRIAELEAGLAEAEKDYDELDGFMNRIDTQVAETLIRIGSFPPKPAGYPDRIDVLCEVVEKQQAEIERLIDVIADPKLINDHDGSIRSLARSLRRAKQERNEIELNLIRLARLCDAMLVEFDKHQANNELACIDDQTGMSYGLEAAIDAIRKEVLPGDTPTEGG